MALSQVTAEIDGFDPEDVFYLRSDGETDAVLLDMAREAGFNVIEGRRWIVTTHYWLFEDFHSPKNSSSTLQRP